MHLDHRFLKIPYKFVPPRRSDFWSYVASRIVPLQMRKTHNVHRWDIRGAEHLKASIDAGKGVLIAPNHIHTADPPAVGLIGISIKQYFYYAASWHLFAHGGFSSWVYRVTGGLSIYREGSDSEAVRECARILAEGDRPLVLFPEGTYFWQNDRLGPLREGLSLIVRQATKKGSRPIVVHPVALKYWCLEDPHTSLNSCLDRAEAKAGWKFAPILKPMDRYDRLFGLFLTSVELEHLGTANTGTIEERIQRFNDCILSDMEERLTVTRPSNETVSRCQLLRPRVVRLLLQTKDPVVEQSLWRDVHLLWLCQQLHAHHPDYLKSCPSWERLTEALCRAEEDLDNRTRYPVPMGVVAEVGEAIDGSELTIHKPKRGDGPRAEDPLIAQLSGQLQSMLADLVQQGPPSAWRPTGRPVDWLCPNASSIIQPNA